jgi:hypothetical protein
MIHGSVPHTGVVFGSVRGVGGGLRRRAALIRRGWFRCLSLRLLIGVFRRVRLVLIHQSAFGSAPIGVPSAQPR